jgi:SAM-dependent methyltransferase
MLYPEIEGLKFPAEYVTRFFFKQNLHRSTGTVLELGSGNGNNLMLFYQFGWNVIGVDKNESLVEQARQNFVPIEAEHKLTNTFQHVCQDMIEFVEANEYPPADVLLLPSSVYYLSYDQIVRLFRLIREKRVVKDNGWLFVSVRTPNDYRFGKGERLSSTTFRLDIRETGEAGCVVTFLTESEIVKLLREAFEFADLRIMHQRYDNYQGDFLVVNDDITLWGRIAKVREIANDRG